ncbi:MAG: MFS transporter [Bacillota bacterium]|nr:MFS transporter [Bacillota bacterium]
MGVTAPAPNLPGPGMTPRAWRRSLILVAGGVFLAQVAFSLVIPFLPMFLRELGVRNGTSLWSGLAYSVTFLAAGVMAPVWGSLADRYGKRPMIVRAGVGMAITYLLTALVTDPIQLLVVRLANGLVSGFIPAAVMLVSCTCPEEQLALSLGVVQAIGAAGGITGPLLGGIMAELVGIRTSMVVTAFLLVLATLFPVIAVREERPSCRVASSIMGDVRGALAEPSLRVLFTVLGLAQAAVLVTQPTLPLWIEAMVPERAEVVTGIVFSVVGIATVVGSPLAVRLGWLRYRTLLLLSLLVSALFSALQALPHGPAGLGVLRFFFGLGNAGVTVAGNTLIARSVGRESRGRAFGVLNSFIYLGSVLGPLVGGAVGQGMGLAAPFHAGGLLLGVCVLLLRSGWRHLVAEGGTGR